MISIKILSKTWEKDRSKEELGEETEKLVKHIEHYLDKDIWLDQHNLNSVMHFLDKYMVTVQVNPKAFVDPKEEQVESRVFDAVIVERDGYHQMGVSLDYQREFNTFYLHIDYLLKKFTYKCRNVDEVLAKLEECNELLKTG